MTKKRKPGKKLYLNWQEADLSTINEEEFEYFEKFCEEVNPSDPESINRLNFKAHMDDPEMTDHLSIVRALRRRRAGIE